MSTRCLLFFVTFLLAFSAQAQWSGARQNLGPAINDASRQVTPLFGSGGDTLYFSEAGSDGAFSVFYTSRARNGAWAPKQKHQLLNPPTPGSKFVYSQLCADQFLINGHFRRVSRYMHQGRGLAITYATAAQPEYGSVMFLGADTMTNSRFSSAFLFAPAKLLFLSIVRGGNEDLFVCAPLNPNEDDWGRLQWGTPQKLLINTPFAETAPWLSADGSTLYFSSDRPSGLGGFDIWSCTRSGAGWTEWTVPKNLGAPVNSKGNERSFTIDPWTGDAIFVSEEATMGGTDIFRIQPEAIPTVVPNPAPKGNEPDSSIGELRPGNIVFLLDLSNSMKQQRRMGLLKAAMRPLVAALRPVDKVSLYRFGDHLARLYQSGVETGKKGSISPTDNKRLQVVVDSLRSQGEATNGSVAILEGYREAERKLLAAGNNQLLLVTDGDFPIFPEVEKTILATSNVQLTVVMIDESPEGQRLLAKFRRYPNVQIVTLLDVQKDADALLRSVEKNARRQH